MEQWRSQREQGSPGRRAHASSRVVVREGAAAGVESSSAAVAEESIDVEAIVEMTATQMMLIMDPLADAPPRPPGVVLVSRRSRCCCEGFPPTTPAPFHGILVTDVLVYLDHRARPDRAAPVPTLRAPAAPDRSELASADHGQSGTCPPPLAAPPAALLCPSITALIVQYSTTNHTTSLPKLQPDSSTPRCTGRLHGSSLTALRPFSDSWGIQCIIHRDCWLDPSQSLSRNQRW